MNLLDIIVVVLLCMGSFCFGMRVSDSYHESAEEQKETALKKQYARMTAGVDADDPAQPYVYSPPPKRFSVTKEFVDALRKYGRATISITRHLRRQQPAEAGWKHDEPFS